MLVSCGDAAEQAHLDGGGDRSTLPDAGATADGGSVTDGGSTAGDAAPDAASPRDGGPEAEDATAPGPDVVELFEDGHFQRGFRVMDPDSGMVTHELQAPYMSGEPVWRLAQWGSRASLMGSGMSEGTGSWRWANRFKAVTHGEPGSGAADVSLAVNSDEEYDGTYREAGEQWPHLLLNQDLAERSPRLSEVTEMRLELEAKLTWENNIYEAGHDESLHASQFLVYFPVQNREEGHPDFGNFLWFGVPLYDDRRPFPGGGSSLDEGTGKLIVSVDLAELTTTSLQSGRWVTIDADLLSAMKDAVDLAVESDALQSSNYAHYKIGHMNMGWEMPGRGVVTMRIRGLSLRARLRAP